MAERHTPDPMSPLMRAALLRGAHDRRAVVDRWPVGLGATAVLAACGSEGTGGDSASGSATPTAKAAHGHVATPRRSSTGRQLAASTSTPTTRESLPTLDAFTEKTGIKVNYTEDINDNDEFYGKVRPQLDGGQDTGRDVVVHHRLDGGPADPPRLRAEARHGEHPERRRTSSPSLKRRRVRPGPRLLRCRGRAASPASPTTQKATGGKKIETIDQLLTDPTSRAGSRCSPRCATPSA